MSVSKHRPATLAVLAEAIELQKSNFNLAFGPFQETICSAEKFF